MPAPAPDHGRAPREYRRTLFDRHGPAAADYVRAVAYGLMVFGLTLGALILEIGFGLRVLGVSMVAGVTVGATAGAISRFAGGAWYHVMHSGASTPYEEQFSHEQALVMQGRIAEALGSYERAIATSPRAVEPRVRAADLYAAHGDPARAAALLREVQRIPGIDAGRDGYASNRLVDLLLGPLNDPGRALVELRRLAERYPDSRAAEHARAAILKIKRDRQAPT